MAAGQLNFRYPSVVCLFGYILSFMLGSGAGEPRRCVKLRSVLECDL